MKSKRLLSFLMTLVLCWSLLPFGAFAEDGAISTGSCGSPVKRDVQWSLDSDTGIVTITGTGKMEDYDVYRFGQTESCESPFGENIKKVSVGSGVTRIGMRAFYKCANLTKITLPNTLTSIGSYAFDGCSSLTSLSIPDSVTAIGNYAFDGCSSLKNIRLPEGISCLSDHLFQCCYALKTVYIPAGVTAIEKYAFSACNNLQNIYFAGTKAQWEAVTVAAEGNEALAKTTVSYNCGANVNLTLNYGYSSKTAKLSVPLNGKTTLPTLSRTGYTFRGWATSSGGSVAYKGGASYTVKKATALYAVWKAKTYTIKYYANGGTGAPDAGKKTYGKAFTISDTKPTRKGYTFLGWATSKTATTAKYKAGQTYQSLDGLTLYAVWKAKTYTVTYNPGKGTCSKTSKSVTFGKTYGTLATPTRTGYTFTGWYTYDGTRVYSTTKVARAYNHNLYAHWAKK